MNVNIWQLTQHPASKKVWGYGKIDSKMFTFWGYMYAELSFHEHSTHIRCHELLVRRKANGFITTKQASPFLRKVSKKVRDDFLIKTLKGEI